VSTASAPTAVVGDRYWVYLIARAVPAALVAAFITFSANHSVGIGWVAFLMLALVTGTVVVAGAAQSPTGFTRIAQVAQAFVLMLGAVVALLVGVVFRSDNVATFTVTTAAVFALSGGLELAAGIRARGTTAVARDWIFLGGLSVAFALAIVLIPVDYSQAITIPGKDVPNLTASVVVVGTLGAYAAIAAVYLVIAGLSLKWAKHPEPHATVESAS